MEKRVFGVFAHNEEENIISAIKSIQNDCDSNIYVLINGCSDNTQGVVEEYAKKNRKVKAILLEFGDKANAWNVFVHDLNIEAEVYYFLDGDCEIVQASVKNIELALDRSAHDLPNAVAATPKQNTRNKTAQAMTMLESGGLAGNFYALTKQFIDRIRSKSIRLPIGTIGEDGLVGALAYWNLEPSNEWNLKYILVLKNANFDYSQLSLLSINDMRLYYNRKINYSRRYFQNLIITKCFKNDGLDWLHGHFNVIYDKYPECLTINWRGVNTYFDWRALKSISKKRKG